MQTVAPLAAGPATPPTSAEYRPPHGGRPDPARPSLTVTLQALDGTEVQVQGSELFPDVRVWVLGADVVAIPMDIAWSVGLALMRVSGVMIARLQAANDASGRVASLDMDLIASEAAAGGNHYATLGGMRAWHLTFHVNGREFVWSGHAATQELAESLARAQLAGKEADFDPAGAVLHAAISD